MNLSSYALPSRSNLYVTSVVVARFDEQQRRRSRPTDLHELPALLGVVAGRHVIATTATNATVTERHQPAVIESPRLVAPGIPSPGRAAPTLAAEHRPADGYYPFPGLTRRRDSKVGATPKCTGARQEASDAS